MSHDANRPPLAILLPVMRKIPADLAPEITKSTYTESERVFASLSYGADNAALWFLEMRKKKPSKTTVPYKMDLKAYFRSN